MKKYTIKGDMFLSTLYLFIGKHSDMEKYINKTYDCEVSDEGNAGENFFLENKDKKIVRCIWLEKFDNCIQDQSVLLHELLHFTFDILIDRGIKYCEESEETFTYFLEQLYYKTSMALTNSNKKKMIKQAERNAKSKKRIKK